MRFDLLCPACGVRTVDFRDYESVVLLALNLALAQFKCPGCGLHLSAVIKLTPEMQHEIQQSIVARNEDSIERKEGIEALSFQATREADVIPNPSRISYASTQVIDEGDFDLDLIRPLKEAAIDFREYLSEFKRQLDVIETVDQAIEGIDTGFYHERSDV